jgi:hypothetical protein
LLVRSATTSHGRSLATVVVPLEPPVPVKPVEPPALLAPPVPMLIATFPPALGRPGLSAI